MNDIDTTEAPETVEKKIRKLHYKHNRQLLVREGGVTTQTLSLDDPDCRVYDLAIEGASHLLRKGWTVGQIMSGEAFPDRSLPSPTAAKSGNGRQKLSIKTRAIAQVRADDLTRAAKAAGLKSSKEEVWKEAVNWVRSLTEEQREIISKSAIVLAAEANLRGKPGSLDELLGAGGTPAAS